MGGTVINLIGVLTARVVSWYERLVELGLASLRREVDELEAARLETLRAESMAATQRRMTQLGQEAPPLSERSSELPSRPHT